MGVVNNMGIVCVTFKVEYNAKDKSDFSIYNVVSLKPIPRGEKRFEVPNKLVWYQLQTILRKEYILLDIEYLQGVATGIVNGVNTHIYSDEHISSLKFYSEIKHPYVQDGLDVFEETKKTSFTKLTVDFRDSHRTLILFSIVFDDCHLDRYYIPICFIGKTIHSVLPLRIRGFRHRGKAIDFLYNNMNRYLKHGYDKIDYDIQTENMKTGEFEITGNVPSKVFEINKSDYDEQVLKDYLKNVLLGR